jgi:hypothetical protein
VALAEAGRSEFEIMAVLGHKTSRMAVHYCREANKHRLNEKAIKAWEAADDLPDLPALAKMSGLTETNTPYRRFHVIEGGLKA